MTLNVWNLCLVRLRIKTGFSIYCGAIKPTLIFYDFYWLSINDVMYELFVWSRWTLRVATRGQFFLDDTVYVDSDSKRIRQKFFKLFINEKVKKILYFLICILPNYVPHEITKVFWKNSHFEKMTAGFILRYKNWLRQNTPPKDAFSGMNFLTFTNIDHVIVIVLTKWSLCCI